MNFKRFIEFFRPFRMRMKSAVSVTVLACIVLMSAQVRAENPVFLSPAAAGAGGCAGALMETGNFFQNPASIAPFRGWSTHASYGFSEGGISTSLLEVVLPALPLSFGAMIGYRHGKEAVAEGEERNRALGAVSFGGDITRSAYWGASFLIAGGNGGEGRFSGGGRFGLLSRIAMNTSGDGFAVYEVDASITHLEAFGNEDPALMITRLSSIGVGLLFFRSQFLAVRFLGGADVGASSDIRLVKSGIEAVFFNSFFARSGWLFNAGDDSEYFTLGLGIRLQVLDYAGGFDYAMAIGAREYLHYFGASARFGGTDTAPPRAQLAVEYPAFSPNGDGVQDEMIFRPRVKDESAIRGWVLQITDRNGKLVREFRSRNHSRIMKLLISPLSAFSRSGSVALPERIWWDGTDEQGRILPDGLYYYAFHGWDEYDNISRIQKGQFSLDTVAPSVSLRGAQLHCRPGVRPLEVEVAFVKGAGDKAVAVLLSEKGKEVHRWNFDENATSARLVWDGTGTEKKAVESGRYSLSFKIEDSAGNRGELELKNIIVGSEESPIDLVPEEYYFAAGRGKSLKFITKFQKGDRIAEWKLRITDSGGKPVREVAGSGTPPFAEWDGRDAAGKLCADGLYLCAIEIRKNDAATSASQQKAFVIDGTAPRVSVSVSPKEFTPDGDYYDDAVVIVPDVMERWAIAKWEAHLFDENGETVKKYSGKGPLPESIRWSGRLSVGKIPFSLEKFDAQLTVWDKAGNEGRSSRKTFSTGLMIIPAGRRHHIVFPNYGFRRKSGEDERLKYFLNLLSKSISRVDPARIELEVHSDFEGDDDANLINTEKAAGFAKEFLVSRGIDEKIIHFRGMGETRPLFDESAGKARRKNDRIEVFLELSGE